jgi:hypothetical protein
LEGLKVAQENRGAEWVEVLTTVTEDVFWVVVCHVDWCEFTNISGVGTASIMRAVHTVLQPRRQPSSGEELFYVTGTDHFLRRKKWEFSFCFLGGFCFVVVEQM